MGDGTCNRVLTSGSVGMGIPMGIPVGMGWVWGLKCHPHGSPAYQAPTCWIRRPRNIHAGLRSILWLRAEFPSVATVFARIHWHILDIFILNLSCTDWQFLFLLITSSCVLLYFSLLVCRPNRACIMYFFHWQIKVLINLWWRKPPSSLFKSGRISQYTYAGLRLWSTQHWGLGAAAPMLCYAIIGSLSARGGVTLMLVVAGDDLPGVWRQVRQLEERRLGEPIPENSDKQTRQRHQPQTLEHHARLVAFLYIPNICHVYWHHIPWMLVQRTKGTVHQQALAKYDTLFNYVNTMQWRSRTFGRPGRWSNLPPFRSRFLKLESLFKA